MTRRLTSDLAHAALHHANALMSCACEFILNTEVEPYSGGECMIFALETSTQEQIALRIEHTPSEYTPHKVQQEVDHLEALKATNCTFMPILLGYSISLPVPFIALRWVNGKSATWSDISPIGKQRHSIIRDIAQASMDMLIVSTDGPSALNWITGKIQRTRMDRAKLGKLSGISVEECQRLVDKLQDFFLLDLDDAPHILVHGDLQASNLIVNGDAGLQWYVYHFAAVYPRFLTSEPIAKGDTFFWPEDSEAMQQDRQLYLQCIKEISEVKGGIALDYYAILAREDEAERYWWLSAISQLDIMKAFRFRVEGGSN